MKAVLLPLFFLAACATGAAPEPIVRTVEVQVPVIRPCPIAPSVSTRPSVPDTTEAIRAAPNLFERVRLLMAGREIRDAWIGSAESAMRTCSNVQN